MATIKPTSPWITYYRELNELFRRDNDVDIIFDDENYIIKVCVVDSIKADAISKLLQSKKRFGDITLEIEVVPANGIFSTVSPGNVNLFRVAFNGNDAVERIQTTKIRGLGELTYVVFENRVVQYFNDDISDINGLYSTLYQDIAKRVLKNIDNVFFCTDMNFG